MTNRAPLGTVKKLGDEPQLLPGVPTSLQTNLTIGWRTALSTSRVKIGLASALENVTGWVPLNCTAGRPATVTLGVPLIPTFHAPLCAAPTVPCTGSGVLVTVTGAEPAAPAGLLGTSDSATVKMPDPTAINISLLNCFMSVLLTDKTYFPARDAQGFRLYGRVANKHHGAAREVVIHLDASANLVAWVRRKVRVADQPHRDTEGHTVGTDRERVPVEVNEYDLARLDLASERRRQRSAVRSKIIDDNPAGGARRKNVRITGLCDVDPRHLSEGKGHCAEHPVGVRWRYSPRLLRQGHGQEGQKRPRQHHQHFCSLSNHAVHGFLSS